MVGSMLLVPQQLFPELEVFFFGFKITVLSTFLVNKKSWICYDLLKTILLLGNPLLWESIPIGSMYGIYANIGGILMVNVTIYSSTMDPTG